MSSEPTTTDDQTRTVPDYLTGEPETTDRDETASYVHDYPSQLREADVANEPRRL